MQSTPKSQSNHRKPQLKPYHAKSLLEKITSNTRSSTQDKNQSGKIIIAKLGDFVENKCVFGINCAHLRGQA